MIFSLVIPERQVSCGLSMMVVSIISTGAGSVGVSARPNLPATDSTSGTLLTMRSCHAITRLTSLSDVLGSNTGIKSKLPSFKRRHEFAANTRCEKHGRGKQRRRANEHDATMP